MAEIIPFKGVLYNPVRVDSSSVVAPPYDIVTPESKEVLYKRSPYNIIRIDFGKDTGGDNEKKNRYTRASRFFNEWLKKGILTNDNKASFYCYQISYIINGKEKKLRGLIGAVRLEELGKGRIHLHEMTYSKPKADRLNILRFCRANISPIFSLYSSKKGLTSSILEKSVRDKAIIEARDGDSFIHRLWRISDKTSIEAIKKEFSDKDIFIADGHHRYEVALELKSEMEGKGGWDYVMMFLANIEDDGLTVLPTHRLIRFKGSRVPGFKIEKVEELLKPYFWITIINFDMASKYSSLYEPSARGKMFKLMKKGGHSLGMFIKNKNAFYVLKFKGQYSAIDSPLVLKKFDVTILHKLILEKLLRVDKIKYEMNPQKAIENVERGRYDAVFFLNPTKIEEVKKVALTDQRMPPKSTYFYPKLLTGMVIYKFQEVL